MVAVVLCAVGCVGGGAQVVLQRPVSDQCVSAGLNGCGHLTRGALLYAEGDPAEGKRFLTKGLAANADKAAQLADFARALRAIGSIPGAGQYVAPLRPAIDLISAAAKEAAAAKGAQIASRGQQSQPPRLVIVADGAPSVSQSPRSVDSEPTDDPGSKEYALGEARRHMISGFMAGKLDSSGKTNLVPCKLGDGTSAWCIYQPVLARGYITDLMVSAGCDREVFILEGSPSHPYWMIWSLPGQGTSEHDLHLHVRTGGSLVAGMVTKSPNPDNAQWNWRCGVTFTQVASR